MSERNAYESFVGTKDEVVSSLRHATGCDKYDVLAAVACGVIGGITDVFLVGAPGDGKSLEKWSDQKIDNAIIKFANFTEAKDEGNFTDVAHAIDSLEKKFKVNYDQRYGADVGHIFDMSTRDHHLKSLAHSPDLIGLFFSILNQFTSTASFVNGGQLITVQTDNYDPRFPNGKRLELQGHNVESKLFCGVANWLGHIMSDIAGSSITRRQAGDGSGVAVPFFELLQFCDFGSFKTDNGLSNLADLSIRVFQEGYDAQFALSMGVPVLITDLSTRLIWTLRRHFQKGYAIRECTPSKRRDDLRIMLLIGNATLCTIDGADAYAHSGGGANAVLFVEHLNFIAWLRLATLVVREIAIRTNLERDIIVMKELNEALSDYLEELKKVDLGAWETESSKCEEFAREISATKSEEDLNTLLLGMYRKLGISRPWKGSFDEHMADKNGTLRFE